MADLSCEIYDQMAVMKTRASRAVRRAARKRPSLAPANMCASTDLSRSRVERLRPKGEFWTDDELLAIGAADDLKHELWNGKIITMPPAGARHGDVIMRLATAMAHHVYEHKLGRVYDGQTGFRLSTDYCFAPDISFVSKERLKIILPVEDKLFHGAPDLVVEVLSPSDSITATEKKMTHYLVYGARLGWMVDPKNKTIRAYREPAKFELLRSERTLTGNAVLPGFRYALSKLFEAAAIN